MQYVEHFWPIAAIAIDGINEGGVCAYARKLAPCYLESKILTELENYKS